MVKTAVTLKSENPLRTKVVKRQQMKTPKSHEWEIDQTSGLIALTIHDPEGMYPFILRDPERGDYRIIRTRKGGLQMIK